MDATVVVAAVLGVLILLWVVLRLARRGAPGPATRRTEPLPHVPPHVVEEALGIARGGNKIAAIKLVRERTGLGLKEAKDVVEAAERGEHHRIAPASGAAAGADGRLRDDELRALVADGQTIEAVKRVREHTGWGLAEAKDYVEGL